MKVRSSPSARRAWTDSSSDLHWDKEQGDRSSRLWITDHLSHLLRGGGYHIGFYTGLLTWGTRRPGGLSPCLLTGIMMNSAIFPSEVVGVWMKNYMATHCSSGQPGRLEPFPGPSLGVRSFLHCRKSQPGVQIIWFF